MLISSSFKLGCLGEYELKMNNNRKILFILNSRDKIRNSSVRYLNSLKIEYDWNLQVRADRKKLLSIMQKINLESKAECQRIKKENNELIQVNQLINQYANATEKRYEKVYHQKDDILLAIIDTNDNGSSQLADAFVASLAHKKYSKVRRTQLVNQLIKRRQMHHTSPSEVKILKRLMIISEKIIDKYLKNNSNYKLALKDHEMVNQIMSIILQLKTAKIDYYAEFENLLISIEDSIQNYPVIDDRDRINLKNAICEAKKQNLKADNASNIKANIDEINANLKRLINTINRCGKFTVLNQDLNQYYLSVDNLLSNYQQIYIVKERQAI